MFLNNIFKKKNKIENKIKKEEQKQIFTPATPSQIAYKEKIEALKTVDRVLLHFKEFINADREGKNEQANSAIIGAHAEIIFLREANKKLLKEIEKI
jgi:ClpP class serine protease